MPLFFPEIDINTLKNISKQLVQYVMDVEVLLFKINPQKTETNIYGQAKKSGISYSPGVPLKALVAHNPQDLNYNPIYSYRNQTTFKFLVSTLKEHNIYPEIGDVIEWNNQFWEITKITQQQLLGNRTDLEWSKICETTILSPSKVKQLKELKLK